jgi:hypothetical protein
MELTSTPITDVIADLVLAEQNMKSSTAKIR